jgi:hypothetical protein
MKAKGEYYLKCLADRVAGYENTKKRYTIDWKYGRIEEDRYSNIQDCEFQVNHMLGAQKHPRGPKTTQSMLDAAISNKIDTPITGSELF